MSERIMADNVKLKRAYEPSAAGDVGSFALLAKRIRCY
jgi:hypothetical protein